MRMGICFATVSFAVNSKLESIMNKVVNDDGREVEEVGRQVTCASNYNLIHDGELLFNDAHRGGSMFPLCRNSSEFVALARVGTILNTVPKLTTAKDWRNLQIVRRDSQTMEQRAR